MREELEKRMYFLTMYNISPIQQGIQCGHAALRYAKEWKEENEVWDFIEDHETWIILNGGTSNSGGQGRDKNRIFEKGTMEQHLETLIENEIRCTPFYEPDLNNSLTSICFIVDERVFNREDYPHFDDYLENDTEELRDKTYEEWLNIVGGEKTAFLKDFLSQFKLA